MTFNQLVLRAYTKPAKAVAQTGFLAAIAITASGIALGRASQKLQTHADDLERTSDANADPSVVGQQ